MHVWDYGITADVHVGLCSDYHVAAGRASAARNQKRHSFAPQHPYLHARLRNEDILNKRNWSEECGIYLPRSTYDDDNKIDIHDINYVDNDDLRRQRLPLLEMTSTAFQVYEQTKQTETRTRR